MVLNLFFTIISLVIFLVRQEQFMGLLNRFQQLSLQCLYFLLVCLLAVILLPTAFEPLLKHQLIFYFVISLFANQIIVRLLKDSQFPILHTVKLFIKLLMNRRVLQMLQLHHFTVNFTILQLLFLILLFSFSLPRFWQDHLLFILLRS